jgi:hypothetical protein
VHTLQFGENKMELAVVVCFGEPDLGHCLGGQERWILDRTRVSGLLTFPLVPLLAGYLATSAPYTLCRIVQYSETHLMPPYIAQESFIFRNARISIPDVRC